MLKKAIEMLISFMICGILGYLITRGALELLQATGLYP